MTIARKAKADAKAAKINAESDIAIRSLQDRTKNRVTHQEEKRQLNIESIAQKAIDELPENVSEAPVDPDWLSQFLNRAQDVNDEQMQFIWAKIIAGEVAKPNSYSKRTLQFLETLDKHEANVFTEICSYSVIADSGYHYLIENEYTTELLNQGVGHAGYISHFVSIGLLASDFGGLGIWDVDAVEFSYFDEKHRFHGAPRPQEKPLGLTPLQKHIYTRNFSVVGEQLAEICGAQKNESFINGLSNSLNKEYEVTITRVDG